MGKIIKKVGRFSRCCLNCLSFEDMVVEKGEFGCCLYRVTVITDPWDICGHFRFKTCRCCKHFFDNPRILQEFKASGPVCIIVNDIKETTPDTPICKLFKRKDEDD